MIGTHGVITNSNNTGLGLKLFKTDDDPRESPDLREVVGVFKPQPPRDRGRDAEGWRNPSEVMMTSIDAVVESIDTGNPCRSRRGTICVTR